MKSTKGFGGLALLLFLTSCGGEAIVSSRGTGGQTQDAGMGGTAGSSGGSGGSGGARVDAATTDGNTPDTDIPPSCQVSAPAPGPYPVRFRFHNNAGQSVYLRELCILIYNVTACSDGYMEPIRLDRRCTVDCSDPPGSGCIACEMCLDAAHEVAPGVAFEDSWNAMTYTFGTSADGCRCSTPVVLPSARYRIEVPVYETESAALLDEPAYEVPVNFVLPAPGGVVDIALNGM